MAIFVGVPFPTPYDEEMAVVSCQLPTLEVRIKVEASDREADRTDRRLEELMEVLDCR
jgi:hypothetical protein